MDEPLSLTGCFVPVVLWHVSGFFGPIPVSRDEPLFTVKGPSHVPLHIARRGTVSFDVANLTDRPVRTHVFVAPISGAELSWFDIEGETRREIPADGQATIDVLVQVPEGAPFGTASFTLVASVEDEPSEAVKSPTVEFTVPKVEDDGVPRWIVVVLSVALALAVAAAVGILIFGLVSRDETPPEDSLLAAAWLENGGAVGIVTWGDVSCTPVVTDALLWDSRYVVELTEPDDEDCAGESVPRASLGRLTEPLDMTTELEIVLAGDYQGIIRLAGDPNPLPEAEFGQPSAGWYSSDGLAVLTWGSTSCPPEVESTEVTAADELTVVLVESTESSCTRDIGRRVTIAEVDASGLGDGRVTAVLQLDGSEDVEVPIAGVR